MLRLNCMAWLLIVVPAYHWYLMVSTIWIVHALSWCRLITVSSKNNPNENFLKLPRIKPKTVGWEATTLSIAPCGSKKKTLLFLRVPRCRWRHPTHDFHWNCELLRCHLCHHSRRLPLYNDKRVNVNESERERGRGRDKKTKRQKERSSSTGSIN